MKRVALYVRVSTQEQRKHGLSVDNQIQALEDYSKEMGYQIVNIYNDAGFSARKTYKKRPALLELVKDCRSGKIDLILFTKLDRWFRSVADYYEVQKELDLCHVPWRAIWEDYETETSAGIFKVNIMLSVAQSEADRTSERIKNTFEYKLARGEYVGGNKAPLGFKRTGTKLIREESEEAGIIAFFDTYLATLSQKKACESAKQKGLTQINPAIAERIINHPAYYGGLAYVDCQPYITMDQHMLIEQAKRKASRPHASTGYKYIFSGLCTCGVCGGRMTGSRSNYTKRDGSVTPSIRYVCSQHEKGYDCTGSSMSEINLEKYLLDVLEAELASYSVKAEAQIESAKNDIPKLKQRLSRLRDMYELGDIERAEYISKRDDIVAQIDETRKELPSVSRKLPSNWLEVYHQLDEDHKRSFWMSTLDHVIIDGMCCKKPRIIF